MPPESRSATRHAPSRFRKVLVIGLDGLEPSLVAALVDRGLLPNMAGLVRAAGLARVATTAPAQTPVAWSTFATGTNPGGHGIFDFLRRNPRTYLPDLSFSRYEQPSAFVPPRAVNLRRGQTVWQVLDEAGLPSTVIRCPCTYPPDAFGGRMLSGMGVPDLRGGLGTATFYSTAPDLSAGENERVVALEATTGDVIATRLVGPRRPRLRDDLELRLTLHVDRARQCVELACQGQARPLRLEPGRWSDWLPVRFRAGLLQSVRGVVRFLLVRLEPHLELYASPVNFDPQAPLFPISTPPGYAAELAQRLGTFYTTGMVEDHAGLNNGRFDEAAYLQQCDEVWAERRRMMRDGLGAFREGLFYCLFDTPDRVQHMFWRFLEDDHPAHRGQPDPRWRHVIEETYRTADAVLDDVLEVVDDQTLLVVLSDHGFGSFRRGVHLNHWLHAQGLLTLADGVSPGPQAGELLAHVDWSRTKAYALGLSGIYLNVAGREGQGIVAPDEAPALAAAIAQRLTGLVDPQRQAVAVRRVTPREEVYSGPYTHEAPDILVHFAPGYRISWGGSLGSVAQEGFEDNTRRWSGDHLIDPELVPGVLLANHPLSSGGASEAPRLLDLAPTILAALGLEATSAMEGRSLLPSDR